MKTCYLRSYLSRGEDRNRGLKKLRVERQELQFFDRQLQITDRDD